MANGSQCSSRGARRTYCGSTPDYVCSRCLPSGPEARLQTLLTAGRGSLVVPASCPGGMLIKSLWLEEENAEMCWPMFLAC